MADFIIAFVFAAASLAAVPVYSVITRESPNFRAAKSLAWVSALGFWSIPIIWSATHMGYSLPLRMFMTFILGGAIAASLVWVLADINGQAKAQVAAAKPIAAPSGNTSHEQKGGVTGNQTGQTINNYNAPVTQIIEQKHRETEKPHAEVPPPAAFTASGGSTIIIKGFTMLGDGRMVEADGKSHIEATDVLQVTPDQNGRLPMPKPTGQWTKASNTELVEHARKLSAEIISLKNDFDMEMSETSNRQMPPFTSMPPSEEFKAAWEKRNADIAALFDSQKEKFNSQIRPDALSITSEIASRIASVSIGDRSQSNLRKGFLTIVYGTGTSYSGAADLLTFLADHLPRS